MTSLQFSFHVNSLVLEKLRVTFLQLSFHKIPTIFIVLCCYLDGIMHESIITAKTKKDEEDSSLETGESETYRLKSIR